MTVLFEHLLLCGIHNIDQISAATSMSLEKSLVPFIVSNIPHIKLVAMQVKLHKLDVPTDATLGQCRVIHLVQNC